MLRSGAGKFRDALKEKRKKRRKRVLVLTAIGLILGVIGVGYSLFFSGWFSISQVQVNGNKEVSEEQIKNQTNHYLEKTYLGTIRPFSNILFTSSERIERSLKRSFPVIESVNVNKNFFDKNLVIEIKEREAVGIWCNAGTDRCFYFDSERLFFKEAPRFSGPLFLAIEDGRGREFNLGDRFDDSELLAKIIETKRLLDELAIIEYSNFYLPPNSFEFWVKAKEDWDIYLDKETNIPTQMVALKKFLEEKLPVEQRAGLEYINLRINNRIFYR